MLLAISVMLDGIITVCSEGQMANAYASISFTVEGISTECSAQILPKADLPIFLTLAGTVNSVLSDRKAINRVRSKLYRTWSSNV